MSAIMKYLIKNTVQAIRSMQYVSMSRERKFRIDKDPFELFQTKILHQRQCQDDTKMLNLIDSEILGNMEKNTLNCELGFPQIDNLARPPNNR
jgi:hypothetical protein